MLWPTTTTRSAPASARTASTGAGEFSMLNLPFTGAALLPCPGKSSVITRYFALKAGTCALHDDSSQVQPCTKITACEPFPVDVQCTFAPSTFAADAARANAQRAERYQEQGSDLARRILRAWLRVIENSSRSPR